MTRTIDQLVSAEVHYCVSSLVSTLANGSAPMPRKSGIPNLDRGAADLFDLTEQALALASPIDDWDEAAIQAGWTLTPYDDSSPAKALQPGYWSRMCDTDEANDEDEDGFAIRTADDAQQACEADSLDPYQREVFEHWIVSDWLADRLAEKGEKVDKDFAGLTVWARTTTGQGIASDSVIEAIYADLMA